MPYREEPRERLLRLFNEIDRKNGKISKWDFRVIAGGTEDQFKTWVTDFLLAEKFVKEVKEGHILIMPRLRTAKCYTRF
jgi:hypothetical protein